MYIHTIMPERKQAARRLVTDARHVVGTCPGLAVRVLSRRITRFYETRMASSGLGFPQFALLLQVAGAAKDTIGALADRLDLDPSTLSRNLRSLERAGLVEIAMVEKDQRRRAVWLTERGARRLQAAVDAWRSANDGLTRALGRTRLRQLRDLEALLDRHPAVSGP
jgi:DNA-binding MarR family transcriptional regulator